DWSYSPEMFVAVWSKVELVGADGSAVPLAPARYQVKTPSQHVFDITGKGGILLRGSVGIENQEVTSDLNPRIRFFVFDREPTMDRLLPAAPETPLPEVVVKTAREAID